nr:Protein of unknown function DUF229 domain containing protein [Haemonchus contortus]
MANFQHCKVYKPITQLVDGCIFPKKDRGYNVTLWVDVPSEDRFECDIVETECTKNDILESFLHMQIVEQKNSENSTKPDVYVLIIDSASSFMVKRSLPKTLEYLRETMGGVQMEFLNKVGDNSRPNGFPLAFGKSIEGGNRDLVGLSPLVPDWNDAEICSKYLDEYPYYLQQFKDNGYKIGNIRLGQYENLNPFLMVMIPAAYRSTPMHLQLKQKVLQLITNFDIHATLMDILKVELGDYFAEQLNLQLTNGGVMEKCQRQFYNRISSMRQLYDQDDLLYDVVVYLSPSNGLFSAFIRRNASGLSLGSGFSRLDRYGRQGDCLVGNTLRPLCHCNGTTIP